MNVDEIGVGRPSPTRGVAITLDRERRLRYSLGTMRRLREAVGAAQLDGAGIPPEHIGTVIWYGLRHEDPDLTLEAVEEMVDAQNLKTVTAAILEAFGGGAEGNANGEAATPPPPAHP